ncbi:hypothetical protein [Pseudoalteromonas holothuriae]|nr:MULTISPECIES: hypothetical protein [unclassified Pseudoalteromonas]
MSNVYSPFLVFKIEDNQAVNRDNDVDTLLHYFFKPTLTPTKYFLNDFNA